VTPHARRPQEINEIPGENFMKLVIAICCTTMLIACQEAAAATPALQAVDFSTMSCEQFWQKTPASDRGPFLFWLSTGGLNRSMQHFILEGKDGVWDGTKIS
jgi:hypothetical protein